jgi:hypothetical protein
VALCGSHCPYVLSVRHPGIGGCSQVVISWYVWLYLWERDKRYVRRSVGVWPVTCIWGSVSGTYTWLGGVFSGVVGPSCVRSAVHGPCSVLAVKLSCEDALYRHPVCESAVVCRFPIVVLACVLHCHIRCWIWRSLYGDTGHCTVCCILLLGVKLVAFLCGCFLEAVHAEIGRSVHVGVIGSCGHLKVVWGSV